MYKNGESFNTIMNTLGLTKGQTSGILRNYVPAKLRRPRNSNSPGRGNIKRGAHGYFTKGTA
jgi:hypothetical protein